MGEEYIVDPEVLCELEDLALEEEICVDELALCYQEQFCEEEIE